MFRLLLAGCLCFVANDVLAVTLQFSCVFGVTDQYKALYPNPGQLSNTVLVTPEARTTTSDKYWKGSGPNNCTFYLACLELPNNRYRWFVTIVDINSICVCQAHVDNLLSSSAPSFSAPVGPTPTTLSIFGT